MNMVMNAGKYFRLISFFGAKRQKKKGEKKEPQRCTYYKVEKTAMRRKKISEMVNENSGDGKTGKKKKKSKCSEHANVMSLANPTSFVPNLFLGKDFASNRSGHFIRTAT